MMIPTQVASHYHLWIVWLTWNPTARRWEQTAGPWQFSTTIQTWSSVVLQALIDGFLPLRMPADPPKVWRFVWVLGYETTQPPGGGPIPLLPPGSPRPVYPSGWHYYGARPNYTPPVMMA